MRRKPLREFARPITSPIVRVLALAIARPLRSADRGAGREDVVADAIVVLGAPLSGLGGLTAIGHERVTHAAQLWHRGWAPRVVVCGGITGVAICSEAEAMAMALVGQGVPVTAISVESDSLTTAENARYSAALLRILAGQQGKPSGHPLTVWLVTQPFHSRRARWCFRRAGLHPRVWHISDSIQYRNPMRALRWCLREYMAWTKALLLR